MLFPSKLKLCKLALCNTMYIMQTCIVEHHIMQHCITAHKIMKHYIIGRYIMQHCILKCHIMQACIVKHKIAQICARQTFPFIFAALEIKLAVWPIDKTTSLLRQFLQRVISKMKNCNDYSASFDSIMYWVDCLYGCIFRYSIIQHGIIFCGQKLPNL